MEYNKEFLDIENTVAKISIQQKELEYKVE